MNPRIRSVLIAVSVVLIGGTVIADEDIDAAMQKRAMAVESMIASSGDESLEHFIDENLSPTFSRARPRGELLAFLRTIRRTCAAAGGIDGAVTGPRTIQLTYHASGESHALVFQIEASPPYKISELTFKELDRVDRSQRPEPFTWENVADRLEAAEKAGFAGAVVIVRAGKVVLDRGYGMADRERGIANTPQTVFAIGSLPIDFTRAAILKLTDLGKIDTSDLITRWLADVPADKRAITVADLMTGRSGLPNFHHIPGEDEDPDLTWIDRDTAVRRIMAKQLLFAPGEGEAHSHSAWVLLAALVEIVSGERYDEFLREHLFTPAGMEYTGLYTDAKRYTAGQVAVGYGPSRVGPVNSPAHWGETSWLVMGSGGMISNPRDLHRWVEAVRSGKILSPAAQEAYWLNVPLMGGNDRGFLCAYTEGPGTMVFVCSNSHESDGDLAQQVARGLVGLAVSEPDH